VHQAQIAGGGGHHADRGHDEDRDAQRPGRNSSERFRRDHRPQQDADHDEAWPRKIDRYRHGPASERGNGNRQHRARDQSAGKAHQLQAHAARRRYEQRLGSLHELA
jgi:hypothetical protein